MPTPHRYVLGLNTYDHDVPRTGFVYGVPEGPHLFQPDNWNERASQSSGFLPETTASVFLYELVKIE